MENIILKARRDWKWSLFAFSLSSITIYAFIKAAFIDKRLISKGEDELITMIMITILAIIALFVIFKVIYYLIYGDKNQIEIIISKDKLTIINDISESIEIPIEDIGYITSEEDYVLTFDMIKIQEDLKASNSYKGFQIKSDKIFNDIKLISSSKYHSENINNVLEKIEKTNIRISKFYPKSIQEKSKYYIIAAAGFFGLTLGTEYFTRPIYESSGIVNWFKDFIEDVAVNHSSTHAEILNLVGIIIGFLLFVALPVTLCYFFFKYILEDLLSKILSVRKFLLKFNIKITHNEKPENPKF